MGNQFAIIYDIIIVAVVAGLTFAGAKKGFASAVVSLATMLVAFFAASVLSGPLSEALYTSIVEKPLEKAVDATIDEALGKATLSGMSHVDYDKVKITGTPVTEITPDYAGTDKAVFELTMLDLSETGIDSVDLTAFGIKEGTDFSCVSGKTATFTMAQINKYGLGKLCVAQYIAVSSADTEFFRNLTDCTEKIAEAIPLVYNSMTAELNPANISALRTIIILMADMSCSAKSAIIDGVIEPVYLSGSRTVIFLLVFAVVSIVLSAVAAALKLINMIPLLGKLNSFLGGVLGLAEGAFALLVICAVVRMIIQISGGNMLLFNETAIADTYLFGRIYNYEFPNSIV